MTSPLHSTTWLVWTVAVTVSLQLARNPLMVAITLALVWLVVETHRRPGTSARAFRVLLTVAVAFAVLRVVLIGLTNPLGPGAGGALVTLPQVEVPWFLGGFSVGGAVSTEIVLQTAIDSFVVIGIMAVFGAFNSVASHHELLSVAPRAFHEPGLVLTVALAFVPSTLEAATAAREADRARTGGMPMRAGRVVRLALPVLETGLQRAVHLAESMDSRGYGRTRATSGDRWAGRLGLTGLLGLTGAVLALVGRAGSVAAVLAGAGVAALIGAIVVSGRSAPSRYRPRPLRSRDAAVMAAAVAVPVALGACAVVGVDGLTWDPAVLPRRLPGLPLLPTLALAGLAAPVLVAPAREPLDEPTGAVLTPATRGAST